MCVRFGVSYATCFFLSYQLIAREMAKKGGVQQLQTEINTSDELHKFLDRDGLIGMNFKVIQHFFCFDLFCFIS